MAEGRGFEPLAGCPVTGFQDQLLKPLGHPSVFTCRVILSNMTAVVNNSFKKRFDNMSKISAVVIFASPHSDGNCNALLQSFIKNLDMPLDTVTFDAYNLSPAACTNCGFCKTMRQCALRDLDALYDAIEKCNLLIVASPVYNMSFPAPMKAILDRFQMYYNARFSLGFRPSISKHRKAVLLACAGNEKEDGGFMTAQLKQSFSVMNTDLCACAVINGLDKSHFNESDERIAACADAARMALDSLCC